MSNMKTIYMSNMKIFSLFFVICLTVFSVAVHMQDFDGDGDDDSIGNVNNIDDDRVNRTGANTNVASHSDYDGDGDDDSIGNVNNTDENRILIERGMAVGERRGGTGPYPVTNNPGAGLGIGGYPVMSGPLDTNTDPDTDSYDGDGDGKNDDGYNNNYNTTIIFDTVGIPLLVKPFFVALIHHGCSSCNTSLDSPDHFWVVLEKGIVM